MEYPTENKEVVAATLSIDKHGTRLGYLSPAIEMYNNVEQQRTSEVAIRSTLMEDLYTILADYEEDGSGATFKVIINPMVAWIWYGGIMLAIGTLLVMLPDKRERRRLQIKYSQEVFADESHR